MKCIICLALSLFIFACSWNQWGKDLGQGFIGGLEEKADSVGGKLVGGALDTLTGAKTKQELNALLDTLGNTLAKKAVGVRDSLIGETTQMRMQKALDSLLGVRTQKQLGALREELIGIKTKELLGALRTEVLGDSSRELVGALRDELLGPKTKADLVALMDTAMYQLALRFRTDVRPELQKELSFIQKNAALLLVLLAVLCCGVVAFIFWQKAKLARLVQTLTFQIHEIPDQRSYDELVHRIRRKSQQAGLEPYLRQILSKQGILGEETWHLRRDEPK